MTKYEASRALCEIIVVATIVAVAVAFLQSVPGESNKHVETKTPEVILDDVYPQMGQEQ